MVPAQTGTRLGVGQLMHVSQQVSLIPHHARRPCCSRVCSRITHSQPSLNSSSRRSTSRRSSIISQAVAAPAPEFLLEKGGPGAKYGNGAVAKVRTTAAECEAGTCVLLSDVPVAVSNPAVHRKTRSSDVQD
jgi:hypothetical protein